jgi:hypothetical protein
MVAVMDTREDLLVRGLGWVKSQIIDLLHQIRGILGPSTRIRDELSLC